MTNPTRHELFEGLRRRDQLLDEASRLLAAGAGDTSPEYQEFVRLRREIAEVNRTRDLDHCVLMVRKKTKEIRVWLRRMDRSLDSVDAVGAIIAYVEEQLQKHKHAPYHEAKVLSELLIALESGAWVPESMPEKFECPTCDRDFDDKEDLFQHCAHTTCSLGKADG